ncbi:MAG TPA: ribosome maturation factor RimP [Firmicutes bacterium]|nr:ribosome maturation factor RimP [Bacillota bacterium]
MNIEKQILELIEKPINDLGYENVSVTYKRENGTNYLRVLIDKDDVISLDDIVRVNDLISPILDEKDLIEEAYILDVSTYGAEKSIDVNKLEKYVGKYVRVHLTNPYKGENYLEGSLDSVSSDIVSLTYRVKSRLIKAELNRKDIDKARLAIKF